MSSLRKELQEQLRHRNKEILIKEAIIAIVAEQAVDYQQQLAQAQPVAPQNPPVSNDATPPAPPAADPTAEQEVTVDSMIDKLNVIRGGTSFSDPEVYGQLTTFWNALPEDQRVNLDAQLNNVGKIVSIAEPNEAQQPQPPAATQAPAPAGPSPMPGNVPQASSSAPIVPS